MKLENAIVYNNRDCVVYEMVKIQYIERSEGSHNVKL